MKLIPVKDYSMCCMTHEHSSFSLFWMSQMSECINCHDVRSKTGDHRGSRWECEGCMSHAHIRKPHNLAKHTTLSLYLTSKPWSWMTSNMIRRGSTSMLSSSTTEHSCEILRDARRTFACKTVRIYYYESVFTKNLKIKRGTLLPKK